MKYQVNHSDIEHVCECPICSSKKLKEVSEVELSSNLICPSQTFIPNVVFLSTACCEDCGFVFRNRRPSLSWFEKNWKLRENDVEAVKVQAHWPEKEKRRYDKYQAVASALEPHVVHKKILDIGCGPGTGLKAFQDQGWSVTGVEPDPVRAKVANETHKLNVLNCTAEAMPDQKEKYDLITIIQVLEHFHHPREFVAHCLKQMKDDGLIYLEVPHLHYFCNWEDSLYLEHMCNFTENTLVKLGETLGLKPVKRYTARTRIDGYNHMGILFAKKDNERIISEIDSCDKTYMFELELYKDYSDEWKTKWGYDSKISYLENVNNIYRRVRRRHWEMSDQSDNIPFSKEKLKFIVPEINDICNTFKPFSSCTFSDNNQIMHIN